MNKLLLLIFLKFFLCASVSFGSEEEKNPAPKEAIDLKTFSEKDFKPHMIDHYFEGCPTNSKCSPEVGKKRNTWVKFIKSISNDSDLVKSKKMKKFIKNHGVPLGVFANNDSEKDNSLILWDSPCKIHNKKEEENIYLGEVVVRNFLEAKRDKVGVYIPHAHLMKNEKEIQMYMVPRGENPSHLEGDKLIYIKEEDGHYYSIKVDPKGVIELSPPLITSHNARSIRCPKELIHSFIKNIHVKNLYQDVYCKELWNSETKKYRPMIFGLSCQ